MQRMWQNFQMGVWVLDPSEATPCSLVNNVLDLGRNKYQLLFFHIFSFLLSRFFEMKWNLFLGSLIFWQVLLPYFQLLTEMLYAIHYTLNSESHKDLFSCVYENCNCEFKWRIFHEFCLGLWTWIFDCWMHDTQWFENPIKSRI